MPQIIDRANEAALSTLFDDTFLSTIKQNLGFDPDTPCSDLPVDIEDLLADAVSICETQQWRFILQKPVTLLLPYKAFLERDGLVFLPYGSASSLTTFTYTDVDGDSNAIDSSDYTIYAGEPLKLWCDDWSALFPDIDETQPYPVTVRYTTGYSAYAQIPKSTIRALKILCYHMYEYKDAIAEGTVNILPQGYEYHRDLTILNCHRAIRYVAEDFESVGR